MLRLLLAHFIVFVCLFVRLVGLLRDEIMAPYCLLTDQIKTVVDFLSTT